MYPRIYLAIDNCFASKRWTTPEEWIKLSSELDVHYVEASADNECDPLYSTPDYLTEWTGQVRRAGNRYGVRVCNLYSGHGTYATLGLGHNDPRVRDHVQYDWLFRMLDTAHELGAGLGFFCHAFPQRILENRYAYSRACADLYDRLAAIAQHAAGLGGTVTGVEQMYSPHLVPWTINGAAELLSKVYARGANPFYLTIDVGHQCGQRRFLMPTAPRLREVLLCGEPAHTTPWLGLPSLYEKLHGAYGLSPARREEVIASMIEEIGRNNHLFAQYRDGDPYAWLEELGCYAPIVHLQQTDGASSSHKPFTAAHNARGIVHPMRILEALRRAYEHDQAPGMPPNVKAIYLTLEIFSGTADRWYDIVERVRESVRYWRCYVPRDGVTLDELLDGKRNIRAYPAA